MSAKKITETATPRMFVNSMDNATHEKMECGARELEGIRLSLAYASMMMDCTKSMEGRLKTFPGGMKRWKTALTHMNKLNKMFLDSVPDKTYLRLYREKDTHAWYYQPINVDRKACSVVNNEDIRVLINQIISDNCAVCLKERSEWRGCKLRKTMIQVSPPADIDRKSAECPYQIVARNCEYGDYMNTHLRILGNEEDDQSQTRRG